MDRIVIVGGGISGLSLAYLLRKANPSLDIAVLEAGERLGGKIWTDRADGFLCEGGVNGFLNNKPRTLELAADLSLKPIKSNDAARKRFIFSCGKLHPLPESPPAFFRSNLLSVWGRLRIMYEMFAPRGTKADESLAEFGRRRLGREAFEKLIDPMASGIYAGDPEALSLKSCFPRINQLETEYGSLIRALIRLQIKAKKEGRTGPGPGPGGVLTSFFDGMETFILALRDSLGERVMPRSKVTSLVKNGGHYTVHLQDGSSMESDCVVMASPAHATAGILRDFDHSLSRTLSEIPYPPVSVVCVGYKKEKIGRSLDGFGFLVPFREGRRILGTLWDSSIFPNRAPEGYVLLRSMLGGARASQAAMQDENRLIGTVTAELGDIMGIRVQPDFARVYVHEKAIPQYTIGHQGRLETLERLLARYKGLSLAGNSYRGISVNDCIENSYRLAGELMAGTKTKGA
ncbi:MAG: protoporphyrinogen oxidase [Nitrospirae bacterium]|nr:protoporphyrinogen oxidase [Nitrospirota bacterium]MCL5423415.1 protoporphyrinogen oxidase [Nitrospirota bacterium]